MGDSCSTNLVELAKRSYDQELHSQPPMDIWLHKLFLGNPGTGKTEVGLIYGRVLCALGLLSKGESEYRKGGDFIGDAVGVSKTKTNQIFKISEGKVLIIDEAYSLHDVGIAGYGKDVLDTIVENIWGSPGQDLAVIMMGYEDQMIKMFRESNAGLSSRFNLTESYRFKDFSDDELFVIVTQAIRRETQLLKTSFAMRLALVDKLVTRKALPNFANARDALALIRSSKERMIKRGGDTLIEDDIHGYDSDTLEIVQNPELLLQKFKKIPNLLRHFQEKGKLCKIFRDRGQSTVSLVHNYVFAGNPGTGKSEAAKIMGLLATNKLTEVSGSDLTGKYLGETKEKVQKLIEASVGGVLFIDEAYMLGGGNNAYSKEAVDKLVYLLDNYSGKIVVILAGYEDKLEQFFQHSNTGLRGRFPSRGYVKFDDWTSESLALLTIEKLEQNKPTYTFPTKNEVIRVLMQGFDQMRHEIINFSNARLVIKSLLPQIESEIALHSNDMVVDEVACYRAINEILRVNHATKTCLIPLVTSGVEGGVEGDRSNAEAASNECHNILERNQVEVKQNYLFKQEYCNPIVNEVEVEVEVVAETEEELDNYIQERLSILKAAKNIAVDATSEVTKKVRNHKIQEEINEINEYIKLNEVIKGNKKLKEKEKEEMKKKLQELRGIVIARKKIITELKKKTDLCPAGFPWIDYGGCFRCAGGSHSYVL